MCCVCVLRCGSSRGVLTPGMSFLTFLSAAEGVSGVNLTEREWKRTVGVSRLSLQCVQEYDPDETCEHEYVYALKDGRRTAASKHGI